MRMCRLCLLQGDTATRGISEEDLRVLTHQIHGQRGFAKLVDAFHENHKKYSKKIIEFQVKRMTKYEKRGADPRVKYYLAPEIQEKYDVKVRVCELGIPCLFIPYLSHHLRHLRQDPSLTPNAGMSAEDLKSLTQHIHR